MSWYVLYTKPRTEKRVAEALEKNGVTVYCPLITEIRQWKDRKKKLRIPLFTSYVFVQLAEKKRNIVFDVAGVVRYLFWLGKPAIVRDKEIEIIQDWLEGGQVDEAKVEQLNKGDRVTIKEGVLKGQNALVREIGNRKTRLVLPDLGCTVEVKTKEVV